MFSSSPVLANLKFEQHLLMSDFSQFMVTTHLFWHWFFMQLTRISRSVAQYDVAKFQGELRISMILYIVSGPVKWELNITYSQIQ